MIVYPSGPSTIRSRFNKFRVPSMILILLQFSVVVLAAIALKNILKIEEKKTQALKNYLYIFAGISAIFMLFMFVGEGIYKDWVASSGKRIGVEGAKAAFDMAAADSVLSFFLVLAAIVVVLLFMQKKMQSNFFLLCIAAIALLDVWIVDSKIAKSNPRANETRYFAETSAVKYLKEAEQPFRIYRAFDDKPPNWYMYHKIQSLYGYHAAKVKIYQEFLEKTRLDPQKRNRFGLPLFMDKFYEVQLRGNQAALKEKSPEQVPAEIFAADNALLDMLNVKYLISYYPIPDKRFKKVHDGKPFVFENTKALPRAFFPKEIRVMDTDAFYNHLNNGQFDPANEAILHSEIPFVLPGSEENEVRLTSFKNHEIQLEADVKAPSLMVLSEGYYPAGWKAFVDGKETEIFRTNGILRSIALESGQHKIRSVFNPTSFNVGLATTGTILFLLLGLLIYDVKFRKMPVEA